MGASCCREEILDFDGEVELMHFNLLRSVGKGAFGKVRVVQHKKTHEIYALKYINKQKCIKMKAVDNVIQERRLLEEIECPFVCNLRYAFQDDENLFMVLDLMLGGDLRFHLDRMGAMKEEQVKFYIAELSCALDHLHERRIVHRDIKPDNILLDEFGHAHLTDFNIAVSYRPDKPLTAVAGSMAYMAPEVLAKKGYFDTVDWWSLGVVMFELLFGKRPFRARTNEQLTHTILHDDVVFPESAKSIVTPECIDCIRKFLSRDIHQRLGTTENGGFEKLKRHPWFRNINWEVLSKKKARPVFVPDSKKANFDATHELEELLLEDNPLKVKPRKRRDDDGKQSQSPYGRYLQVMETKFLVYDHTKPRASRSYMTGHMPPPSFPKSVIATPPIPVHMSSSLPSSLNNTVNLYPLTSRPTPDPLKREEISLHSIHKDVMEGREPECIYLEDRPPIDAHLKIVKL